MEATTRPAHPINHFTPTPNLTLLTTYPDSPDSFGSLYWQDLGCRMPLDRHCRPYCRWSSCIGPAHTIRTESCRVPECRWRANMQCRTKQRKNTLLYIGRILRKCFRRAPPCVADTARKSARLLRCTWRPGTARSWRQLCPSKSLQGSLDRQQNLVWAYACPLRTPCTGCPDSHQCSPPSSCNRQRSCFL